MKKLTILTSSVILGALAISACSTNKLAMTGGEQDNMYFMASDAKLATEFAVQNNNPDSFERLSSVDSETYPNENFSSRNVNPEYIARYTTAEDTLSNDMVYFDEGMEENTADINAYDNYRVGNTSSNYNTGFFPPMSFSLGYMAGFSPWGMGGFGYNPFYDPFYMPGLMFPSYGFRPGFNIGLSLGFGMGSFWGPSYAWGGGFYPGFGYPGYGFYPGYGYNRPIYVLPGGEYGDRRVVRGARGTRGATLANAGVGSRSSAILPNTSRAQARREALNSPTNRRLLSGSNSSRATSRDFGNSQNDFYSSNSRSRVGTSRNVSSPAINRSSTIRSTRSAMPTARPSYSGTNSRSSNSMYSPGRNSGSYTRSSSPSYNRSSSPSYNRSTIPSRTSPTYSSPSRTVSPSRSSSPVFSTPSRSSGGSGMSTGGSRSSGGSVSSGSSRGGRGN